MNGRAATAIGVGLVLAAFVVVLVIFLRKPHGGNAMRLRTLRNDPNTCIEFDPSTLPLASTLAYPSKGKTALRCGAEPPSRGFVVWTKNNYPLGYIDTTVPYQLDAMINAAGDELQWSAKAILGDQPVVLGMVRDGSLYVMPAEREQGTAQALVFADTAYINDFSQINKAYCTAAGHQGAKCLSKTQPAWFS